MAFIPELGVVVHALDPLTDKYFELGIQLKIKHQQLKSISKQHRDDHARCLIETIILWQQNNTAGECSWSALADAVERVGGHDKLAKELRARSDVIKGVVEKDSKPFLRSQQHDQYPSSQTDSTDDTGYSSRSGSQVSEDSSGSELDCFELFPGCGCSNDKPCSSLYKFCTEGCPNVHPNRNRKMPVVTRRKLQATTQNFDEIPNDSEDDIEEYEEKTKQIQKHFGRFVTGLCRSFKERNVDPQDLTLLIRTSFPMMKSRLNELNENPSLGQVFNILADHACSWFDYEVIKEIINYFGGKSDKIQLQEYEDHFKDYAQDRLPKGKKHIKVGDGGKQGCKQLVIKIDREWNEVTFNDIDKLRGTFASIFGIRRRDLYLADIREGCIMMTFMITEELAGRLFPSRSCLSSSQVKSLRDEGVISLKCGKLSWRTMPSARRHRRSNANLILNSNIMKNFLFFLAIACLIIVYGYLGAYLTQVHLENDGYNATQEMDISLMGQQWQNRHPFMDTRHRTLGITPNFTNVNKIGIFGNNGLHPVLPVVECEPSKGLTFMNSDNITLESVHFLNCSAPQNSTSRNLATLNSTNSMLKIQGGLYFYNCTNVAMYRVSVVNGSHATGVVMYDVNQVDKCNFVGNAATAPGMYEECNGYGGGGFSMEFTYCHPGDSKCSPNNYDISSSRRNKNASYLFKNSYFCEIFACGQMTVDYGAWLLSSNDSHQAVGRGGGLCVYLKGDATNNVITIDNCIFEHNHAVFGREMFVEMEDNSIGNTVNISDCVFFHNHAFIISELGTGGGGLFICACAYPSPWTHADSQPYRNGKFRVNNCNFTRNRALSGGSVLLLVARQNSGQLTDDHVIAISNGVFIQENRAQLDTALYAGIFPTISKGYVPRVMVENWSFHSNVIHYHSKTIHTVGVGTIYINAVPLSFSNEVNLTNNTGSALGAVGTYLDFTGATALFCNNSGTRGAGIALLGSTTILVGKKMVLTFTSNHASQYGDATYNQYSIREDLKSSTHCFIHYEEPFLDPKSWAATFNFLNNKADAQGNAIYSPAILPCSFGVKDPKQIFCWNKERWNYGDLNCTEQIYTKPMNFFQNGKKLFTPIDIYPGYQFRLPLIARDDLGHEVTNDTLYCAYINESHLTAQVESGNSNCTEQIYTKPMDFSQDGKNLSRWRSHSRFILHPLPLKACPAILRQHLNGTRISASDSYFVMDSPYLSRNSSNFTSIGNGNSY